MDRRDVFGRDGYLLLSAGLAPDALAALIESTAELSRDRGGCLYAARNLFARLPRLSAILRSANVYTLASEMAGGQVRCVRTLFFAKPAEANWSVPWHQDVTIAVACRVDRHGFGPWTRKQGIDHAGAPEEVLDGMVTLRIFLDDCGADEGPLLVLPGSHAAGKLPIRQIGELASHGGSVPCLGRAGSILVMKPLLCHSSARALPGTGTRRVLHLEFSPLAAPAPGLEWYEDDSPTKPVS